MANMTPKFLDFFKSCYYSNTYLSPVDLSEQGISEYLLESEDGEAAKKVQQLISIPEVQAVLSEPLSYDREKVKKNNAVLEKHGFKLLSRKPFLGPVVEIIPFYSVIEHDELDGWVIKSGATRVQKGQLILGPFNDKNELAFFTEEESILRIEMAKRVAKVAQEANIDVIIPKKKLVAYANLDGVTEITRKYCVVCEKIKNILSDEETVQAIKKMDAEHQRELAQKISTIIQKAGLVDASFDNIRLTTEGKLAFIDTEPAGLMVAKKPGILNRLWGEKGASVEKCARIGLFTLMHQTSQTTLDSGKTAEVEPDLEAFREQVKNDYEKVSTPKLSKWKIALSVVSMGLIALINAIVALVKTKLTQRTFEKLQLIDNPFKIRMLTSLGSKPPAEQVRLLKEYHAKRTPIAKQFLAYIEDVPYTAVMA